MHQTILAIKDALEAQTVSGPLQRVKRVYYGDPILIPETSLPAICILPQASSLSSRGTKYDQTDIQIRVKLVQNLKQDMGASGDNVKLAENAVSMMETRDTQGNLTGGILYAIRADPLMSLGGQPTVTWSGNIDIDYSFTDIRGYIAYECTATTSFKLIHNR